jgi:hypothetical protein
MAEAATRICIATIPIAVEFQAACGPQRSQGHDLPQIIGGSLSVAAKNRERSAAYHAKSIVCIDWRANGTRCSFTPMISGGRTIDENCSGSGTA